MQIRTRFFLILSLIFFMAACNQSKDAKKDQFTELALEGKAVFERHECGSCHYIGDEEVTTETEAPDLTDPFLANDSLFVQAHLQFVERTEMPPIELTDQEIRFVSYFIAELHSAMNPSISWDDADTFCPVCYAPVATEQATEAGLSATLLEETYYFECEACRDKFREYPEAFVDFIKQHGNPAELPML